MATVKKSTIDASNIGDDAVEAPETPRLKALYKDKIAGELTKEFNIPNPSLVPGLTKIVVNMGVGEAAKDSKLIDGAIRDLTAITGQKPQVTKARKSIWSVPEKIESSLCCFSVDFL